MLRTLVLLFSVPVIAGCFNPQAIAQEPPQEAHLDIVHGKPFVMVMVDGKGPFRFVIDTGTSGEAFVTSELAQELGLSQSGTITLNDPSRQGGLKTPTVHLASVRLAGVEFSGVTAVVHSLSNADGGCQGLLGFALFRNYLLTLDYPNHRMALASGGLNPDGGKSVLPFRMPDGIPVIALTVGKESVDAQLDTGGAGLSLPESLTSRLRFSSRNVDLSDAHSLSTRFTLSGAVLDGNVSLGSYTFKRPFIEINPAFPLANFGSGPMQTFVVTFDQKNGLVRLVSRQKTLRLAATPAPLRLQNAPDHEAPDHSLVPVG